MTFKKAIITFLAMILLMSIPVFPIYASDIDDHWANAQLKKWIGNGIINGYDDGTVRPDNPIDRAEFVTIVNRIFEFKRETDGGFTDVASTNWFSGDIAKAYRAGYISGYPDQTFRPKDEVTREDAAVILSRAFKLTGASSNNRASFSDSDQIQGYAKAAIETLVENGYMKGYTDHSFKPRRAITRAEAVTIINQIVSEFYHAAGTYPPQRINGNAVINNPNVTLKDTHIEGNLYLAEGIGSGDATLDAVTVKGVTFINGGGTNSIHLHGSTLEKVIINNRDHQVRVVVSGTVNELTVDSMAKLEVQESASIGSLTISETAANTMISGNGSIHNVKIGADITINDSKVKTGTTVKMSNGKVVVGNEQQVNGGGPASGSSTGNSNGSGTNPGDNGSGTTPGNGGSGTNPGDNGSGTNPGDNGGGTNPGDNGSGTNPGDNGGGTNPG
ncbi:S-layer homology domain-containing protein, partial [Paenibacillus sp. N3.4]|uniref:S-layer homology domain-containing protein n=1 Tax=Paenibacillus sp. N3.4 TaxID=2603222 RepID=UPI0011D638AD